MIYAIRHWYHGHQPVPEASLRLFEKNEYEPAKKGQTPKLQSAAPVETWGVELPDTLEALQEFVVKHGVIQLKPPKPVFPHWTIIVTSGGSWGQR